MQFGQVGYKYNQIHTCVTHFMNIQTIYKMCSPMFTYVRPLQKLQFGMVIFQKRKNAKSYIRNISLMKVGFSYS